MKETQFVVTVFLSACWAGIAEAGKNSDKFGNKLIRAGFYITGFLGLWYCYAIATTGIDYTAYLREYQMLADVPNDRILSSGFEIGYLLIAKLLAFAGANAEMALLIFRTIAILNVAVSLWILQRDIDLFFAVFAYVCILFFDGYHIVMMMVASFILLGVSIALRGKMKTGIVLCVIAATIHYSGLLFFVVFLAIYIGNEKNIQLPRWSFLWITAAIVTLCAGWIVPLIIGKVGLLAKYRKYVAVTTQYFGIAQVFYYCFPAVSMMQLLKKKENDVYQRFFYSLIPIGFCVAGMGYSFTVLDRMFVFFAANFVIFIPHYIECLNRRQADGVIFNVQFSTGIWKMAFLIYFILRAKIFISGHPVVYDFGPLLGLFA